MREWLLLFCVLGAGVEALSQTKQEKEPPAAWERMQASQSQVQYYLTREARRQTYMAAQELASRQSWEQVRDRRREEMRDMLGLNPLPARTPLNVQITGVLDQGDYTIEKIAFESLPKVYVTGNLYVPKQRPGPLPAVVYVCGHSFSEYGNKTKYQQHPITLARHGYVAFILDSIQISETFALHHGILNNEMYDWYSKGYTPAGVEVWNVIRALDYLETRPEVDKERFGITGRSGGAAMSWFSTAVDPRLKVAVPVMGISTYAANLAEDTQRLHCDCMFAINTFMHDMTHQGGLIAPRPLYMMHGRNDALFPVKGYQEFERVVGRLYASYEAGDKFKNLEVNTGHEDSDQLRAEAVKWFDRWLKEIPEREIDLTHSELPGEQLAVFSGKPPADAQNYRVHEFFVPDPPKKDFTALADWRKHRDEVIETLKTNVFGAFANPKGLAPRLAIGDLGAVEGFQAIQFDSEPGVSLQALYRTPPQGQGAALLYIASDGEDFPAIKDTLQQVLRSETNPVMIVYPRGVSEIPWEKKFWKSTLRNSMHLGRTIDSMRVWDVIRAAALLRERARRESLSREVVTVGSGVSGLLGLYAALFDEDISQVILMDPPPSHRQGPALLNVLRYTDLPEAAALLAPRRLTFYGRIPAAYEATRKAYGLYGKPDQLSLTMSLEAALNGRHGHGFASGL